LSDSPRRPQTLTDHGPGDPVAVFSCGDHHRELLVYPTSVPQTG
jgi:hypothetical protein